MNILNVISGKDRSVSASFLRFALSCVAPIYRFSIGWRNRGFDRAIQNNDQTKVRRVEVPVISIGNLTTGGTGKTPHVVTLAKILREHSLRVAIVSRGYQRSSSQNSRNDEAMELEHQLPDVPHLQDPDRFKVANIAVEELETQVILMDDGFQHRQLHRDLDVVLIDATLPFGYGSVLPRGLLREPIKNLARADWVIITRSNLVDEEALKEIREKVEPFVPEGKVIESSIQSKCGVKASGKSVPLDSLVDRPTLVVCGIGNPDNFVATLQQIDIDVRASRFFADHYDFQRSDIEAIAELAKSEKVDQIICTHKDLVKLGVDQIQGIPLIALSVEAVLADADQFVQDLHRVATEPCSNLESIA